MGKCFRQIIRGGYRVPELYFDEGMGITDDAFLYAVSVCDYYQFTKDNDTINDLYLIAARQVDLAMSLHDSNGVVGFLDGWNSFIDWAENLKTTTAVEGVYLYTLEKMIQLAEDTGRKEDANKYRIALKKTREDAYRNLFDSQKEVFCNVYDEYQCSVQAQINSWCHAWSCTPSYFIRTGLLK